MDVVVVGEFAQQTFAEWLEGVTVVVQILRAAVRRGCVTARVASDGFS